MPSNWALTTLSRVATSARKLWLVRNSSTVMGTLDEKNGREKSSRHN
jgi:hypothetical protein